jgi:hypothetical protein
LVSATEHAGVVVRSSLAAAGPLERIDRAFVLARRGGLELALRAWLAGGVPALAVLAYYYAERVEGIGALRLPAAFAIVAGFVVRSWALAGVSRAYARALSERAPIALEAGGFLSVGRTAIVVAFGLWVWSWGVAVSAGAGPLGIALFVPWMALRGLVAPSWLARAGCAPESGFRAFSLAVGDAAHQRLESLLAESILLLALLGVALNLYGASALAVLLGRSFLGLEMALVDEFLSFRNTFVLLGVSLASATLLEPLRAGLAAQVYVDARVRAEGLDLREALDEATAHTMKKRADRSPRDAEAAGRVAAALVIVSLSLGAASARAEEGRLSEASAEESSLEQDARARDQARAILSEDIFRDVEARRRDGLANFVQRLFEWLLEQLEDDAAEDSGNLPTVASMPLPGPAFFLALGVMFVAVVALFLFFTRREEQRAVALARSAAADAVPDPRDRAPDDWLAEAATLAAHQRYGEALRAVYLATLVALDRRAWIRFEPSLTNWQYLRQMPSGGAREDFRALTRTFDVKVYGEERAGEADYRSSRALAERILAASRPSAPPSTDAPESDAAIVGGEGAR